MNFRKGQRVFRDDTVYIIENIEQSALVVKRLGSSTTLSIPIDGTYPVLEEGKVNNNKTILKG